MTDSTEKAMPLLTEFVLSGNPIAHNSSQLAQIMSIKFPQVEKNVAKQKQNKGGY